MDVSNEIYRLSGFFNEHLGRGGSITSTEIACLVARMNSIAEEARAQKLALDGMAQENDRLVEQTVKGFGPNVFTFLGAAPALNG